MNIERVCEILGINNGINAINDNADPFFVPV
jgi:hypothetical protein